MSGEKDSPNGKSKRGKHNSACFQFVEVISLSNASCIQKYPLRWGFFQARDVLRC